VTPPDPERERRRYEFERRLADGLRATPRDGRPRAYAETYDTFYGFLQETGDLHPETPRGDLTYSVAVLRSVLRGPCSVLEVASGTGHLALWLAARGHQVVATDVSEVPLAILRQRAAGTGVSVVKTSAVTLDVPGEFDLIWSNDLLEHLHPEDAETHLRAAWTRLKPGGRYILVTPNRYGGPFDISAGYDPVARGLHLKEWTYRELEAALVAAGFRHIRTTSPASHLEWRVRRRLRPSSEATLRVGGTALKRWIEPLLQFPLLGTIAGALGAHPVTLIAERD
jgi:SAM-dependent methyltransferase